MSQALPETEYAVQLVGPSELRLNEAKPVVPPGPTQIVAEVECVGLCFSDLKLLKQFTEHARKGEIVSGIDLSILDQIPSYAPGTKPTVPGHEAVVRIRAVGEQVTRYKPGERYLVQTDYRWLVTEGRSNAAFGYNIEGGLQQFVLMDDRVITSPEGEGFLIPVDEQMSSSAVALVEPWACVEDAYVSEERTTLKSGGRLLVVTDPGRHAGGIKALLDAGPKPIEAVYVGEPGPEGRSYADLTSVADQTFDDIVYLGAEAEMIEQLADMLDNKGLLVIALGGKQIGRKVRTPVGRVHYGGIRIIGTAGDDPAEAIACIPATGELRPGERVHVLGAAGPMGAMHVIRNLCQGVADVTVVGSDVDDDRLADLLAKAQPLAEANKQTLVLFNPKVEQRDEEYSYIALMAPVPALAAAAIETGAEKTILNVFAGIPADQYGEFDLDRYCARHMYMIGTSGSLIRDMKIVLGKIGDGRLDTNMSVAAVSGMRGALDGLAAVENRTIPGKIVVYPSLPDMDLILLKDLATRFPTVHAKLNAGNWSVEAEQELLTVAGQ